MLTLFKNIKSSLKINLSNFGNYRHMATISHKQLPINVYTVYEYYCESKTYQVQL